MTQAFTGQKIIVIGGTSGMGKAIAKLVLQQGGSAVITGSRRSKAETAVKELRQYGKVVGLAANLANEDQRNALIDRINTNHADATLLVNAAGVFLPKPFVDYEESDYDLYNILYYSSICQKCDCARQTKFHRQYRFDVGKTSHSSYTFLCLFNG